MAVALAGMVLAWAGLAVAQTAAPSSASVTQPPSAIDGDSVLVQELIVNAPLLGPALWKVTRGDSTVFILGGETPLPHSLVWDSARVERALGQSRVLLVPPSGRIPALEAAGLAIRALAVRQPLGRTLEPSLPTALRDRFVAERQSLNVDAKPYAHWKPAVAGFLLIGDFRRKAGFSNEKPASTVVHLADARGVHVKRIGVYGLGALFTSLTRLSDAQQDACLADELDVIDFERARARDAAQAWAHGDLVGARAGASGPIIDRCVALLSNYGAVLERGTADFTSAIEDSLKKPGTAVAVIDLRYLLRADGVLDRLKAAGAVVTAPRE